MVDGLVRRDRPVVRAQPGTVRGYRKEPRPVAETPVVVSDVMTSPVLTLPFWSPVEEALTLVEEHEVHHVPLVDEEGRLAGLVSDRDLYRALDTPGEPLERFMTSRLVVAGRATPLRDAAAALAAQRISSLPVVEPDCVVVGIVTVADILGYLVSHPNMELWD